MTITTPIKRGHSPGDILPPAKRRKPNPSFPTEILSNVLQFVPKKYFKQTLRLLPRQYQVVCLRETVKWGAWTPVLELFGKEPDPLKQILKTTVLHWGKGGKQDNELICEVVKRRIAPEVLYMMLFAEKPPGSTFNPGANDSQALRVAMKVGNVEAICALIQHSDVDPTIDNNEPILWAVNGRHQNIIKLLLRKKGIDPRTAFMLAVSLGYIGIVRLFLQNDSFDPSFDNNLALRGAKNLLACSQGSDEWRLEVIQLLQNDKHVQESLNRSD